MNSLGVDIETFSSVDLGVAGVHRYVEAPDFTVLLMAYQVDDQPVECIDFTAAAMLGLSPLELIPPEIWEALFDDAVLKTAHNAPFELTCLSKFLGRPLIITQWECTLVKASMLGYPLQLKQVAAVLGLEQQKDAAGNALIKYFTMPCKPSKANGHRTRNLPEHAPEKWLAFVLYCIQDVRVEQAIRRKISFFTIPEKERQLWYLDQKINNYGVRADRSFIHTAIRLDIENSGQLVEEAIRITGLKNPKSVQQLKAWLTEEMPLDDIDKLRKTDIPVLRKAAEGYVSQEAIQRVLDIRLMTSKSSIKKYKRMAASICEDGRIRGLHQYCGANRTWRWAGRGVQPQNLTKNREDFELDDARQIVRLGELEAVRMLWLDVSDALSQLIRTAFIPSEKRRFRISDFSAIEARVIAWLAGEQWRLDFFNNPTEYDIYQQSASKMFNVPIEQVTKKSDHRAKGKIAELALGFQGGANALKVADTKKQIPENMYEEIKIYWRKANKRIVQLWYDMEAAAYKAVREGGVHKCRFVSFQCRRGTLFMKLPSGHELAYPEVKLKPGRYGEVITYMQIHQKTKQWVRHDTYGGKLTENAVQGIARDCLATALSRLDEAGYDIAMHVHDEAVLDHPTGQGSLDEINKIMAIPMPWAPGLPLGATTDERIYYRKD